MSRCNPCLVVHIGQHKTGSKALQSFLAHNRIALRARGVLYPVGDDPCFGIRAYAISQFRLYALIRREAIGECFGEDAAASYWRQQGRYCTPFDSAHSFFEVFDAEVRRSGLGQVVVSAEDLFDMHTAHELAFSPELIEVGSRRLAALAADFGYDARVVVYLRRQDHLLGAHYVQFIKGSPDHDIDFEEFARAFAPGSTRVSSSLGGRGGRVWPRPGARAPLRADQLAGRDRPRLLRECPGAPRPGGLRATACRRRVGQSDARPRLRRVHPDPQSPGLGRPIGLRAEHGPRGLPAPRPRRGGRPAYRPGSRRQPGATFSTPTRRATPPSHATSSASPTAGCSPNLGLRTPTTGSCFSGSRPNGPRR